MGRGREGQNCRQILNVSFRNLHPYALSKGQLFSLLIMQQKLDPWIPSPALISVFFGSQLVRKNDIIYHGFKYIFLDEQTLRLIKMIKILGYKSIQVILGVSRDLL